MKTLWKCSSALLSAISTAPSDHIDNGGAIESLYCAGRASQLDNDDAIVETVKTTLQTAP